MGEPVALPVSAVRLWDALRSEAVVILQRSRDVCPDRVELDDLVGIGADAYLTALATPAKAPVRHPHARAMARAVGAMRDARDAARRIAVHEVSMADMDFADSSPAERHGMATRRGPSEGILALPRRVRRAVARLPLAQQQVIRLLLRGLTVGEIMQRCWLTRATVEMRRHHAVTALRRALGPEAVLPFDGA